MGKDRDRLLEETAAIAVGQDTAQPSRPKDKGNGRRVIIFLQLWNGQPPSHRKLREGLY